MHELKVTSQLLAICDGEKKCREELRIGGFGKTLTGLQQTSMDVPGHQYGGF
jgi:hypothetical protein